MCRRFSEAEILAVLREAAAGSPVIDLCWNRCIRRSTFYAWKAKYGSAGGGIIGRHEQRNRERAPAQIARAGARERHAVSG